MKNSLVAIILISIISNAFAQNITEISLHSGWLFKKGDNLEWKNPDFDDSDWINILPTGYWDYLPGLADYDGYGWYRISVYLPLSLKNGASHLDSLHIRMGRVDDNDQTFLNGILVGENSRNTSSPGHPEFAGEEGAYNKQRDYTLPLSHSAIRWDAVNVIAVRAYDFYLTGGLTEKDFRLFIKKGWSDYVSFKRESSYLSRLELGKPFAVEFLAENRSENDDFQVDFFAEITLKESNRSVFAVHKEFTLSANNFINPQIFFTPCIKTDYNITYRLSDKKSGQTIVATDLLGVFMPDVDLLDTPIPPKVKNKVKVKYCPPEFSDIHVEGLLAEKMELNLQKGLLNIPYQLMAPYLDNIEPPWPVGEFVGKLLHGNTKMLQYSRDEKLFETTTGVIQIWLNAQDDDGYLGTNSPETRWQGWDVWDHKYLILAFVSYYAITGYQPALDAAIKIGDLIVNTFGYSEGQLDIVDGYHMGMAPGSILETMIYLYKYTGEKKYLDFCQYILQAFKQENGPKIISELTKGSKTVLKVGNAKGYEMMSCIIGIIQLYKITGEQNLIDAATNAWNDIQRNRLYITGTSTSYEHFQEQGFLPAEENDHMGEGCVTAHWMYLTKELFKLFGEQKYIDEIEKSLYNHLLAAQHPVTGDVVYYTALQSKKWYMDPDMYLGPPLCCHMSVKRCVSEIPEYFCYEKDGEIGVLLYNPAHFNSIIHSKNDQFIKVDVNIISDYPYSDQVVIKVNPDKSAIFPLVLRVPAWCSSYEAIIKGEKYQGNPGEYLNIDRKWESGDKIEITMVCPLLVLSGEKSYPDHFALKYGNQVFAVDSDVNNHADIETVVFDTTVKPEIKTYTGSMPKMWVGKQAFISNAVKTKDGEKIILVPFADASQTGGDIRVWIKKAN